MIIHDEKSVHHQRTTSQCVARGATTHLRNPSNGDRCIEEVPTRSSTKKQERNHADIIFNEIRQFAYILEVRERDFIDLIINYNLFLASRNFQEDFQWDTIHDGSNPYL